MPPSNRSFTRCIRRRDNPLYVRHPRIERLESRQLLASVSSPPILQWFESSYDTIEERIPDLFDSGYGAIWLPPPGRADSGNQSVGYDVYDRFDLGSADNSTLYGTRTELQQLAKLFDQTATSLHVDLILNHAGFSDLSTDGFVDSGGYPGLAITLDTAIDGDFHSSFDPGELNQRLSGLVDLNHTTNHVLIRNPVDANAANNIPAGTAVDPYGRLANIPDADNAQFYPDMDGDVKYLFDPIRGESDIPVYSFNTTNPMEGDAVAENALGYLMRYMQWMVEVIGVDGFRVDAAKHFEGFVMDYLDRAVYRANPRPLLDGSTEHVFSYSEVFDGNKDLLQSYVRKNIDPNDEGRIGGNRDVLDFSSFFAMRDNLSSPGTANAWQNIRGSLLDLHDDGIHNGSSGVLFVRSHDEFGPSSLGNVAHAFALMYPGNAVVYFNGSEFGAERDFPKAGRGDALGGLYGDSISTLVSIRQSHGRGDFYERYIDQEGLYIFEREKSSVVGLSNRGDEGFDERTVQVAFDPGTRLVELTGNASDSIIDPYDDLFDSVLVSENRTITIRVPRNVNADGAWHGSGYVIYGLATPSSQAGIELLGVDSVIAGGNPDANDFSNGRTRLADIHVVTGDEMTVNLNTQEVTLPDGNRDFSADGDQAMLRLDGGVDVNGNDVVDHVTPGEVTYGFELFADVSSPLVGAGGIAGERGTGQFSQSLDITNLEEGLHFLEARAFRHRTDGGQPVFQSWKESIYVDRLPPMSDVLSFEPYVEGINENRDLVVQSLDKTADSIHVFLDLPASMTDSEILALVGSGNQARQIDRDRFIFGFDDLTHGNHVVTVVSYERTGNVNVQRIPGLFTSTIFGAGLGDLDFNGTIESADVLLFEQAILSDQTIFNVAADFDANGEIDYLDLQHYSELLVELDASQSLLDQIEALRDQFFLARGDSYRLMENEGLDLAEPGILANDLIPEQATAFFLVSSGSLLSDQGVPLVINPSGSLLFDQGTQFDYLGFGQELNDHLNYVIDDGFGNQSIARIDFTIEGVNDSPAFGGLSSFEVDEDSVIDPIDLGVFDPDHASDALIVNISVGDPSLFSAGGYSVSLVDGNWLLNLETAENQFGTSSVTLTVSDPGGDGVLSTTEDNLIQQETIFVTIRPVNDAPSFVVPSGIALDRDAGSQSVTLEALSAGGDELQPLFLEIEVDDPSLLSMPATSIIVSPGAYDLEITPQSGAQGVTSVSVTLTDGGLDASLDTDEDNASVTLDFEVAVGLSAYEFDGDSARVDLRGANVNPTLRRDGADWVIDLGTDPWFATDPANVTHTDAVLRLPTQGGMRLEIVSREATQWSFDPVVDYRMAASEVVQSTFYRSVVLASGDPNERLLIDGPNPWQNVVQRTDVDNSGVSTAGDALRVINELRNRLYSQASGLANDPRLVEVWPGNYFDVSGEGLITALDALQVINRLGLENSSESGEGEQFGIPSVFDAGIQADGKGSVVRGDAINFLSSPRFVFEDKSPRAITDLTNDNQVTDRFVHAVDQIWSEDFGGDSAADLGSPLSELLGSSEVAELLIGNRGLADLE